MHTATFYDCTTRYEGVDAIAAVATLSGTISSVAPPVELGAAGGTLRWASFVDFSGGTACPYDGVDEIGTVAMRDVPVQQVGPTVEFEAAVGELEWAAANTLIERTTEAWNADDADLLRGIYAADAVHRVVYLDDVTTVDGAEAIAAVAAIRTGPISLVGEVAPLPTVGGLECYLGVVDMWGGMGCVFTIAEGLIARHECLAARKNMATASTFEAGNDKTADGLAIEGERSVAMSAADLSSLARQAWNEDDPTILSAVYAEDAVMTTAYLDESMVMDGIDAISRQALIDYEPIVAVMPSIGLPAPEGELRWLGITNVAGGTGCSMWARRDETRSPTGRIVRQDCLVPAELKPPIGEPIVY